jgi:hypothetical protein
MSAEMSFKVDSEQDEAVAKYRASAQRVFDHFSRLFMFHIGKGRDRVKSR